MIKIGGRFLRCVRYNHALRTPLEQFSALNFVKEQPNPFRTEKSKIEIKSETYESKNVTLITRPALHGVYCTIGLIVGTGSRYAKNHPLGVCHLDEKMAFGGTADSFPSRGELGSFLDHCGGICDAQSDQESTIYALSIDREELENGIKILIETAFRPVIDNETINEGLNNVENEIKYLQYEKIRDKEVVELTIEAGFQSKNIGISRSMSEENFGKTTPENWCQSVKEYRHENYLRTDPAIVAVGVKMEELETAVSKYINLISKPSWEQDTKNDPTNDEPAVWKGGFLHRDSDSHSFSIGEVNNESYFSIGWKAPSFDDGKIKKSKSSIFGAKTGDRYVCHVLRALLGGGSAFESGGPGKGLKSFLYANVLGTLQGQHFSHFKANYKEFSDSGIFTIYGLSDPRFHKLGIHIAQGVIRAIAKGNLEKAQVERAKTQLLNQYLRDMEVRAEMMEAFARETIAYGEPINPEAISEQIRSVRKSDLIRLCKAMLSENPAIAILGESKENINLYHDACKAQISNKPLLGRGSLFLSSARGLLGA